MKTNQLCGKPTALWSALLIALPLTFSASVAQAQVTFFQKPPSAQELRKALSGGGATRTAPAQDKVVRPAGVKVRGIVWDKPNAGVPANTAQQPSLAAKSATQPVPGPAAGMPINFEVGSARLQPNSVGFVRSVAQVLQEDPNVRLVIEGHTDSTGGYKRNVVLSWERAMGVFRILVEDFGIDPERLQPIGKGPREPMPGTAPSDGNNRRVQFRITG